MPGLDDLIEVERLAWEVIEGAPIEAALETMCDAVGGVTGSTGLVDSVNGWNLVPSFARVDHDLANLMVERFDTPASNPFIAALPRMPSGRFLHSTEIVDMDRLKRSDYYTDWWVPTGVNDHGGGIMLPAPDGRLVWTVIGCLGERDWLDTEDVLFAHAACGTIGRSLQSAAAHAHAHAGGLLAGRDPDPSWLLDRHGGLYLANGAGRRMLDDGRGPLRCHRGRLAATEVRHNPKLEEMTAAALRGMSTGASMVIHWDDRFARLVIEPGPRYRDDRSVMATLRPPRPMAWNGGSLREAFGLTRREAEVAIALAGGARPVEIANALDLAPASVRLYLKRVYAKTGVEAQGPLVAMLCGGWTDPAGCPPS